MCRGAKAFISHGNRQAAPPGRVVMQREWSAAPPSRPMKGTLLVLVFHILADVEESRVTVAPGAHHCEVLY
jgi:hypothetical protein